MIKAILLDLDNTLYDYEVAHDHGLNMVFKRFHREIDITYEKFISLYNQSRLEIQRELSGTASAHNRVLYFQRIIEKSQKRIDPDFILELYDIYWDSFLDIMKLKSGVLKTLTEIKKKGIKIAVVSDMTSHIQLRKLKKLRITKFIDVLVTSEQTGSEKPHSIMFLTALNKLKLLPEDAMMVGDNPINDIEGANAIGINTVLFNPDNTEFDGKGSYSRPNHIIYQFSQILEIIT